MSTPDTAALCRFLDLAKSGRSPKASSGERVANKLAKALQAIGDDMVLLDDDAITGFHLLCQLTGGPWATDADKARVFEMLAHAAG